MKQTRERINHDGSPSPPRKSRERKPIHDTPETSAEDEETNHARLVFAFVFIYITVVVFYHGSLTSMPNMLIFLVSRWVF